VVAEADGEHELVAGNHRVVVVTAGGGLRAYQHGDRPVLDGYRAGARPDGGRGQLLAPWPNRLADGAYRFGGADYQCPITEPARHTAIHGLVRWEAWDTAEADRRRVAMTLRLPAGPCYPSDLHLRVEYTLDPAAGLAVAMEATNVGGRPCPFGAGAHPYVTLGDPTIDRATLRAPAATVLDTDGRGIPTGRRPVAGTAVDFRQGRPIGDARIDTCLTDLHRDEDGLSRVVLSNARAAVTVWMDESFGFLMLYTGDALDDPGRRRQGLAVEPMTCAPDAFHNGYGLVVLEPDETFRGTWGISPT